MAAAVIGITLDRLVMGDRPPFGRDYFEESVATARRDYRVGVISIEWLDGGGGR